MIRFNPYKRITVYEALRHPFFASIRKLEDEMKTDPIMMDFEFKGELSMQELKEILLSEIKEVEKAPFGEA